MKQLFNKVSKRAYSHGKIVREILPSFAEKLKKEAVISAYDRHPFTISLFEDRPPIKIIPDLVIHLPNGEKVLVEIANPRDPKRFLGEILYPHLLGYHKKITKVIIYVLRDPEHQRKHDRAFCQIMLTEIFGKQVGCHMASWCPDEKIAYHNLKCILKRFLNGQII